MLCLQPKQEIRAPLGAHPLHRRRASVIEEFYSVPQVCMYPGVYFDPDPCSGKRNMLDILPFAPDGRLMNSPINGSKIFVKLSA